MFFCLLLCAQTHAVYNSINGPDFYWLSQLAQVQRVGEQHRFSKKLFLTLENNTEAAHFSRSIYLLYRG